MRSQREGKEVHEVFARAFALLAAVAAVALAALNGNGPWPPM
jgi:hypothetical protein